MLKGIGCPVLGLSATFLGLAGTPRQLVKSLSVKLEDMPVISLRNIRWLKRYFYLDCISEVAQRKREQTIEEKCRFDYLGCFEKLWLDKMTENKFMQPSILAGGSFVLISSLAKFP